VTRGISCRASPLATVFLVPLVDIQASPDFARCRVAPRPERGYERGF